MASPVLQDSSKVVFDSDGNEHVFPAMTTDAQIAEIMSQSAGMVPVKAHLRKKRSRPALQQAADFLPAVGGTIGGIVGGVGGTAFGFGFGGVPGAIGGAATGGAGGEAARQLLYQSLGFEGAPQTSAEAAKKIGIEGGTQAALEGGGLALAAGTKLGGQALYRAGAKVTPEVAQTAIAHGITATRKGLTKILDKIGEQGLVVQRHLARAAAQGVRFDSTNIARNALAKIKPLLRGHEAAIDDAHQAVDLALTFIRNHQGQVLPAVLNQVKRNANEAAQPIFRAIRNSEQATAGNKVVAMWEKALHDSIDEALTDRVSGYKIANAVESELIKVKNAIAPLVKRQGSLAAKLFQRTAAPAAGGAAAGAAFGPEGGRLKGAAYGAGLGAAGALLTHPSALTSGGLALSNAWLYGILHQAPRVITAGHPE